MASEIESNTLKIVLVGSGNLAYSLAIAISKSQNQLIQIVSTNFKRGLELSNLTKTEFIPNISNVNTNADLYILAVPDIEISNVAQNLINVRGIVVHTSGSTPVEVLEKICTSDCGVFYPFQTFTYSRALNYSDIPVCIEAKSNSTFELLRSFAFALGAKPIRMDSETRKWLHLSGVFACNFVNHMLSVSYILAQENDIDVALLKPLIFETVNKALEDNPFESQTGPALRGDTGTLKRHYAMLGQLDEELRDLYISLSTSIERLHKEM